MRGMRWETLEIAAEAGGVPALSSPASAPAESQVNRIAKKTQPIRQERSKVCKMIATQIHITLVAMGLLRKESSAARCN